MSDLVMYYGTECVHCHELMPSIERLEAEMSVTVDKKETWHDSANKAEWQKESEGKCPGVPFLLNKKTGKFICGKAEYDKLKEWASLE